MKKFSLQLLVSILTFLLTTVVINAKEKNKDCNYTTNGKTYSGKCSFYSTSLNGNRTTSGEKYDKDKFTAAHRTLPFGTKVKVTDARTGKSTIVRINDRGPYVKNRVIDISNAAAKELGVVSRGVFAGKVEVLEKANQN
jgi:rare lipoprotein A